MRASDMRPRVAAAMAAALTLAACGASSGSSNKPTGALAACGSGGNKPTATAQATSGSWPDPNGDLANTRDAAGSTISSANVSKLAQAWTFKLTGKAAVGIYPYGSLAANPIVQNGIVYLQDLYSNVYALALSSGRLEWECRLDEAEKSGPGPNGVAVSGGAVYGASPTTVFALNAATGRAIWANRGLLNSGEGTFGIQPEVADGRVYLASQYGSGPGGGVLIALDAATGKLLWKTNTTVGPDPGVKALGVGAGGAWETPLVGSDNSVTYGIGNPYQTPVAAMKTPARLLYNDSVVNLDAATGKVRWYYQGVPNDYEDHDLQTSPISANVNGVPVVIGSGKVGYVYEMNAQDGKLIWKTPIGAHNGHDDDSLLALEHSITLKAPYTILPGSLGGALSDLSVAGGSVYVATIDLPLTYTNLNYPVPVKAAGPLRGEVEALSLATGKVQWDTKVPYLPVGAVTVSNDLVFTTLYDGVLIALDPRTGKIVYRHQLPTSTNAPLAIAGNTMIVPAGGGITTTVRGDPQVVAYTVR